MNFLVTFIFKSVEPFQGFRLEKTKETVKFNWTSSTLWWVGGIMAGSIEMGCLWAQQEPPPTHIFDIVTFQS